MMPSIVVTCMDWVQAHPTSRTAPEMPTRRRQTSSSHDTRIPHHKEPHIQGSKHGFLVVVLFSMSDFIGICTLKLPSNRRKKKVFPLLPSLG